MGLLFLGDSTVASVGARERGVAERIAAHLDGGAVTNLARSGATTRTVLEEQLPLLPEDPPDVVVIGVGANDVRRRASYRRSVGALTAELLEAIGARFPAATVVHAGSPPFDTSPVVPRPLRGVARRRIEEVNAAIGEACGEHGAFYVPLARDLRRDFAGARQLFSWDRFHVNDDGYELCARYIADAIHQVQGVGPRS